MNDNIRNEYLSGDFEQTDEGIYFPISKMMARGVFVVSKRGEPEEYSENLVVNEGLNYLLNASVGGGSAIASWYVAPFSGNVTVLATWTAANFTASSTEWTLYANATRPAWTHGVVASGGIDSFAAKAEFVSTADGQVVRGAALVSTSAKSSTSGTLIAASRFQSDKSLDTGEILDIGYGLQLTAV